MGLTSLFCKGNDRGIQSPCHKVSSHLNLTLIIPHGRKAFTMGDSIEATGQAPGDTQGVGTLSIDPSSSKKMWTVACSLHSRIIEFLRAQA